MAQAAKASAWFDENTNVPIIAEEARRLDTFLTAMADGRIDDSELKAQEQRVVQLMREIEPQLDGPLHQKVTQLLCELTAYDLMQVMQSLHQARPKTQFRG